MRWSSLRDFKKIFFSFLSNHSSYIMFHLTYSYNFRKISPKSPVQAIQNTHTHTHTHNTVCGSGDRSFSPLVDRGSRLCSEQPSTKFLGWGYDGSVEQSRQHSGEACVFWSLITWFWSRFCHVLHQLWNRQCNRCVPFKPAALSRVPGPQ